jgi:hypothetical protein
MDRLIPRRAAVFERVTNTMGRLCHVWLYRVTTGQIERRPIMALSSKEISLEPSSVDRLQLPIFGDPDIFRA